MEAKDTVVDVKKLCVQVCQEYRQEYLEAKPCDGKDCEECMFTKQAEISFKAGIKEVLDAIHYEPYSNAFYVRPEEWQSKLKDWGLK